MTAKCVRSSTSNAGGIVMVQDLFARHEVAETKLQDMKSNMATLGKEDALAMAAVAAQQQQMTLQRLISMIESDRAYHQKVVQILDHLAGEMVLERQRIETTPAQTVEIAHLHLLFTKKSIMCLLIQFKTVSNNGRAEGKCKRKADCSFSAKDEPSVVKSAVDGATVLKKTEDLLKSIEEHEDDEKRQTETKGTIQTPKELQPISSPINCPLGETKEATVAAAYNVAALSG
ncbi:protein csh3 [Artemisia annua]|uniref:Protein csh3 n=1 Tax=Artemisia annua TaxID=35608 RepID=A0A2U1PS43_ARTAN|nr:protein csh3 [Artemisia annua]